MHPDAYNEQTPQPSEQPTRMTGIWECDGPPLRDGEGTMDMIAFLRRITEAMPPDAPVRGMTVQLGDYRWTFRRLPPLTLLEGPDGGYAVLNQEPEP